MFSCSAFPKTCSTLLVLCKDCVVVIPSGQGLEFRTPKSRRIQCAACLCRWSAVWSIYIPFFSLQSTIHHCVRVRFRGIKKGFDRDDVFSVLFHKVKILPITAQSFVNPFSNGQAWSYVLFHKIKNRQMPRILCGGFIQATVSAHGLDQKPKDTKRMTPCVPSSRYKYLLDFKYHSLL